jgi:hypothetical protein
MVVVAIAAAGAVFALTVMPISGQAAQAQGATGRGQAAGQARGGQPAAAARPARIAGHPNMNGVWQTMTTANWNLEDHSAAPAPMWQTGAIGAIPAGMSVVDGGTIPYKPEALKQRDANRAAWPKSDPEAKCYMPGVPRATYMPYPFQIVQGQKDILMVYEYASSNRIVHMSNHQEAPVDSWMGWSIGKWEGDSLVIEVSCFNEQSWFDRAGNFHSDALKVTERYTPMGDNAISYEATIEDPNTFTRPWKISMPIYRHLEKNAQLLEFKCVEFSEELLYGDLKKKTE